LIAGSDYVFRVRAKSTIDYSDWSLPVTIPAASVPEPIASVTTAPDVPGLDMKNIIVSWEKPFDGGLPITRYTIKFRHIDAESFSEETSQCLGSESDIKNNLKCTVQIGILTTDPYSLSWGSEIIAKVSASNRIGESIYTEGGGAFIVSRPDRPIFVSNMPDVTDAT